MYQVKHIILGFVEFVFIMLIVFGFLCVVSEAEPWSVKAQIWLFIKGIIFMAIGALGCAFIERRAA